MGQWVWYTRVTTRPVAWHALAVSHRIRSLSVKVICPDIHDIGTHAQEWTVLAMQQQCGHDNKGLQPNQ